MWLDNMAHHRLRNLALVLTLLAAACTREGHARAPLAPATGRIADATFAGGCFWCVESAFDGVPGVVEAISGYTGGPEQNPTYRQVATGRTGHVEAVRVRFDPRRISYQQLLELFWRQIDPTDAGGQFADRGKQYTTAIFYHSRRQRALALESRRALGRSGRFDEPIVTPIRKAGPFYAAEDYHQDYHRKNPGKYRRYRVDSGREGFLRRVWGGRSDRD